MADAVAWIITRDRRVAVNEILVRAGEQTWLAARLRAEGFLLQRVRFPHVS